MLMDFTEYADKYVSPLYSANHTDNGRKSCYYLLKTIIIVQGRLLWISESVAAGIFFFIEMRPLCLLTKFTFTIFLTANVIFFLQCAISLHPPQALMCPPACTF